MPGRATNRGPQRARPADASVEGGTRSKGWTARVLALVGGYVDAVGYVALYRLFTAHQSGNSAGLGVALGTGDWTDAWRRATPIGAYVLGVALASLIVELWRRFGLRGSGLAVTAAEVVALAGALVIGQVIAPGGVISPASTGPYVAAAACLAGGMGFQTVALRRIGRWTVRTTFVTGVLTNMAESFVAAWFQRDRKGRSGLLVLSRVLGSLWLGYIGGAVAGAAAESAWGFLALAAPIAAIVGVGIWGYGIDYAPVLPERDLGDPNLGE